MQTRIESIGVALLGLLLAGACAQAGSAGGQAVYASKNCAMCHGANGEGTPSAPALVNLKSNWDAASLSAYLKDPQGYAAGDPRLSANLGKYSIQMPAAALTPEEESALIDYLLSR